MSKKTTTTPSQGGMFEKEQPRKVVISISTNEEKQRPSSLARKLALVVPMLVFVAWLASSSSKPSFGVSKERSIESMGRLMKEVEGGGPDAYPKPSQVVHPDPPLTSVQEEKLAKEWGKWKFTDKKAKSRPSEDYYDKFSNRDVPWDEIPDDAWQKDLEYMQDFLDEGLKLVERAMEAILAEYGHGKKDNPNKNFAERSKMFQLSFFDFAKGDKHHGKDYPMNGGWTTRRSFDGLIRRLLHALATRDTFTVILGGHSAAAGHGNLFQQSYMMQFHKVMEPVFAMLGVKLTSRNLAHGGLGTLQSSMGFRDIYGAEIDVMIWDCAMTESRDQKAVDLFMRQAIISGNRVPYLHGGMMGMLKDYHERADVDVGQFGQALEGIPTCTDDVQALSFPFAARYMKCDKERQDLCVNHKFRANCWVPRDDVTPPSEQAKTPRSQVSWHPGFRWHQIVGRTIAFTMLSGLKEALTLWQKADNFVLKDDAWHVHDYYQNIRTKVLSITDSSCYKYKGSIPLRFCDTPVHGRTEFTPRSNPEKTSILSMLKPTEDGFVPYIKEKLAYTGRNVFNNFTAVPEGSIDVLAIVSNGRDYGDDSSQRNLGGFGKEERNVKEEGTDIEPGLGFYVDAPPGYCDGTYNVECNRASYSGCLLSGHNDERGGIFFNSYSGWMVMTLPQIKEGIIVAKIETWHNPSENKATQGWKSVNNKVRLRNLRKQKEPEYCENFKFEFAIDGKITAWDKDEFKAHDMVEQRVVEVQTLLDDPDFTDKPKDVELALRMTGCGDSTKKEFKLTHIYFA